MNYKLFFRTFINIIFRPGIAWDIIIKENRPVKDIRNSFFYPLIILVTIASFLGSIIFTNNPLPPVYSVLIAIKCFVLFLFVTFTSTAILSEITKPLDLGKNYSISFRLIVYSLIPLFVCQIVSQLFESLIFVNILALSGLYIFWTGAEKMLYPPEYKKMPMLISIFVVVTGIYFACNWLLTLVFDRIFYSLLK